MKTLRRLVISLVVLVVGMFSYGQTPPCNNLQGFNIGSGYGISNVTLGALNHTTPIEEGYSREYDSVGVIIPDLAKCETYLMTVTFALPLGQIRRKVWIDWNSDGDFLDLGEEYDTENIVGNQLFYEITIPFSATLGNKIVRVAAGGRMPFFDECTPFTHGGDFEDYRINIIENDMVVDSIVVEQAYSCFLGGSQCQPILRIAVHTTGTQNPVEVTGFDLNTNGSTDALNDFVDAKIVYTGDSPPVFSCNTTFGILGSSPSGVYNISGSQLLNSTSCRSIHYFWLTYDIAFGATANNIIDAEAINVSIVTQGVGSNEIPLVTSPSGSGLISTGIEICDNGLDDDCDGLVDCFDSDCSGIGNCISQNTNFFYGLPEDTCSGLPLTLNSSGSLYKKWTFSELSRVTPAVVIGDLDGDQVSEIVFVNSDTNLVVLDGKTGSLKRTIAKLDHTASTGLLADADKDGSGEVYWTTNGNQLFCYDYITSDTLWGPITYPSAVGSYATPLAIADFDGDDVPELYDSQFIINSLDGGLLGLINADLTGFSKSIAVDVLPDNYCTSCQGLELLIGNQILSVSIDGGVATVNKEFSFEMDPILQNFPASDPMYSTVADVDDDNMLDIITTSPTMIFSWNPRTRTIIDSISFSRLPIPATSSNSYVMPATVEDVNNDGNLDFIFTISSTVGGTTNRNLIVLDNNFNFLWNKTGMAEGSAGAFPTVFDLNGDGNKEVIYRPEFITFPINNNSRPYLFTLDAASGAVIDSVYCRNLTLPGDNGAIVADVDGDGKVEIITTGFPDPSGNNFMDPMQLMVIGNCMGDWVCGRNTWNQHSYHPSFINDDLTVPKHQQNHAAISTINSWGNQVSFRDTLGDYVCPLPDVTVVIDSAMYVTCDSLNVFITVCNNGRRAIHDSLCTITKYLSYYNGNPLTGGTLILTDTIPSELNEIGTCSSFNRTVLADPQPLNLYIVVNDNGTNALVAPTITFTECNTANNVDSIEEINQVIVMDTVTICDGDSVFLANGFQVLQDIYIDTLQTNQGCDSIINTLLNVLPLLDATITFQGQLCLSDDPVELTALDTGGVWTGNGIINSALGTYDPKIAGEGMDTVTYVIATLCGDSNTATIEINSGPSLEAIIKNDSCKSAVGAIGLTPIGFSPFVFNWNDDVNEEDRVGLSQGTYSVIVSDSLGCETEEFFTIIEGEVICSSIYLPNTFTPNMDNVNDVFFPEGVGINNGGSSFRIYNRWGNLIFESQELLSGWDGTYKGKLVSDGVYVWKIEYVGIDGIQHSLLGKVTVLK